MTEVRSNQIAMAAAKLDCSGHEFIQSCITAGLLSLAEHDKAFALCLARAAHVDWKHLKQLSTNDTVAQIMGEF